jgi:hypothetical protein
VGVVSGEPVEYTAQAVDALTTAAKTEHDFSGWLAAVLAEVRNACGGWDAMESRPGSWEAALVEQLIGGTNPEGGW